MTLRILFGLLAALALTGCGKKTDSAGSPTPSQPQATEAAAGATRAQAATDQPQSGANANEAEAALSALTQAVRKYSAEKQKPPQNLDEVVAAGYVTTLPPAPQGKRYAINPKRLEVILIKK